MPTLKVATEEQIAEVHRESHAMWGAGLDLAAYNGMWTELRLAPWALRYFSHYVWADDDGTILSSAKVYRPLLRAGGRTGRSAALGAVFTPRKHRGHGNARAMLRELVEEARRRSDRAALLFSDIGTGYYSELGFRGLPADEASGTLRSARSRRPSDCSLRPMTPEDLDAVVDAHTASSASRSIALVRDRPHWEFLLARARNFFSRLDGSDLSRRYRVAVREGRFAGYVVAAEGDGEWNLREVGSVDGEPATMGVILRAAAAEAKEFGMVGVYGWLTREVADLVPEWRLRFERRSRALPMLLPLEEGGGIGGEDAITSCFVPYLDQF